MCIAILNRSGIIPDSHILNSFSNNPDGAGIAWIENGDIKVYKTMNDREKILSLYKSIRLENDSPIVLHFRIGTHGEKDISNVHPFHINQDMIMVHNGIIDSPIIDKQKSDTFHLSLFLSNLSTYKNLVDAYSIEYGFAHTICAGYSKLIFMDNDGRTSIVNEDHGYWIEDTWYSNKTYNNRGLIDIGGKSVKKDSYTLDYYGDWFDDSDISDDSENEGYISEFCDYYNIPISYIDSSTVSNWEYYDVWDIDNWEEFSGKLQYVGALI